MPPTHHPDSMAAQWAKLDRQLTELKLLIREHVYVLADWLLDRWPRSRRMRAGR